MVHRESCLVGASKMSQETTVASKLRLVPRVYQHRWAFQELKCTAKCTTLHMTHI